MSNIVLTIDHLAGTHITEAKKEAAELAKKLNVNIEFTFNMRFKESHI